MSRWGFEFELGHKAVSGCELGSVDISILQKQTFPTRTSSASWRGSGQMAACL